MLKQVREFHEKFGWPINEKFDPSRGLSSDYFAAREGIIDAINELEEFPDPESYRAFLLAEEFAEFLDAMENNNEVAALDAATDMLYVLVGTFLTFGWDMEEAFRRVHESNMSKGAKNKSDPGYKGEGYVDPDLGDLING